MYNYRDCWNSGKFAKEVQLIYKETQMKEMIMIVLSVHLCGKQNIMEEGAPFVLKC